MPKSFFTPKELQDDDLNREPVLNLMCNGIARYFKDSSYYESNVFLLNGEFGSGKTWILNKIEAKSKKVPEIGVEEWVKYSAYQYFSEKELFFDFYSAIQKAPVTQNLEEKIEYINGAIDGFSKVKNCIGELGEKGDAFLSKILDIIKAIPGGSEVVASIPYLGNIVSNLQTLKTFKDQKTLNDQIGESIDKITELLESQTKNITSEVTSTKNNSLKNLKTKKTVIVLDDLDRLHEDKLWRIFTLLSLFEDNKNILFILVGSREYIKTVIDKKYSSLPDESEDFIAKFIAWNINLPKADQGQLFLDKCAKFYPEIKEFFKDTIVEENISRCYSYRELKIHFLQPLVTYINTISSFHETEQEELNILFCLCILNMSFNNEFRLLMKFDFYKFDAENQEEVDNLVVAISQLINAVYHNVSKVKKINSYEFSMDCDVRFIGYFIQSIIGLSKLSQTSIYKLNSNLEVNQNIIEQYKYFKNTEQNPNNLSLVKMKGFAEKELLFEILKKISDLSFFI